MLLRPGFTPPPECNGDWALTPSVYQELPMDYSCYCLHFLASVMFNGDLKSRHKLEQLEANGPRQSKNGHEIRIMQFEPVQSHQHALYLRKAQTLHQLQLCAKDI